MAAKYTAERILQDGDDRQTQRSWLIEGSDNVLIIKDRSDSQRWVMVARRDLDQFISDLRVIAKLLSEPE